MLITSNHEWIMSYHRIFKDLQVKKDMRYQTGNSKLKVKYIKTLSSFKDKLINICLRLIIRGSHTLARTLSYAEIFVQRNTY